MRRILLVAHRWLGLTAGVVFAIASLTGGILVYQNRVNDVLLGPRADITPGLVELSVLESSSRQKYPDSRLLFVEWPNPEKQVFSVRMTDGKKQQFLELDPGSGKVLRTRGTHVVVTAVRRFHGSLLLGKVGRTIVQFSTIAGIASLLTGLYLWWPGILRLAHGFKVRFGKGLYAVTYDLHQTSGVIALPLLLLMSVTGLLFDSTFVSFGDSSWPSPRSVEQPAGDNSNGLDLAGVVKAAEVAARGQEVIRVDFPTTPRGVFEVWVADPARWFGLGSTRLGVDRYTGAVVARQKVFYDSGINDQLHFGSLGGWPVRALYAIVCLVGGGLFFTGALIWWKKGKPLGGR